MAWKMGLAYPGTEDTATLGRKVYPSKVVAEHFADEEAGHFRRQGYAVARGHDNHWVVWKPDDESTVPFKIVVRRAVLV